MSKRGSSERNKKRSIVRKKHKVWSKETAINELLALDPNDVDFWISVQVIGEELGKFAGKQPPPVQVQVPQEIPVPECKPEDECFICTESIFSANSSGLCSCSACNQMMHFDCIAKWRANSPEPGLMISACCRSKLD